ncbi:UNVERIFIED_CONTAM: hypothetical protein K2H54_014823 [Gekko kuhli]
MQRYRLSPLGPSPCKKLSTKFATVEITETREGRMTPNSGHQTMDVQLLEIPAELAALLRLAEGQHHGQINQVTEVSPPEVKAKVDLSLPTDINTFPFSTFMKSHFQEATFPALGQPLQQPLTRLDAEDKQNALQLNKLSLDFLQILRFINEKDLQSWQEELLGNYIARQGLASPSLRNELFCQVASQVWKNPDLEQCQRGWVLMAALLGTFTPSPALEKPLLKFVSDCGLDGYNAMCQRKLLTAVTQMEDDPEVAHVFPPTRLEWTTSQRKGKMVLDVHTYEDTPPTRFVEISVQVLGGPIVRIFDLHDDEATPGNEHMGLNWEFAYASVWVVRGLDRIPRGWSVSMFTGKTWQDLPGCDFVLDLIGEMEECSSPSGSSPNYPITPERDESYSQQNAPETMLLNIPPAPAIQAPSLPQNFDREYVAYPGTQRSYVSKYNPFSQSMENEGRLTGRMKGGGQIGPTQQGVFPTAGLPILSSDPTAMVVPQPMLPSVDPNQLAAAQQQAFINQQALLMIRTSQEKQLPDTRQDSISRETFQKKIEYFQRMGQNISLVKKDTTKRWSPPRKMNSEDQVESQRVKPPVPETGPSPPPSQKDDDQEMKMNKALPPRVKHLELTQKSEPSKEIQEIIKTHKSRPVPPPKPIMPVGVNSSWEE